MTIQCFRCVEDDENIQNLMMDDFEVYLCNNCVKKFKKWLKQEEPKEKKISKELFAPPETYIDPAEMQEALLEDLQKNPIKPEKKKRGKK